MKKINFILISVFFIFIFSVFYLSLQNEQIYDTEDLVGKTLGGRTRWFRYVGVVANFGISSLVGEET